MSTPEAVSATLVRVAAEFVVFQVHLDMVLGECGSGLGSFHSQMVTLVIVKVDQINLKLIPTF